jgi:hypothetical protein
MRNLNQTNPCFKMDFWKRQGPNQKFRNPFSAECWFPFPSWPLWTNIAMMVIITFPPFPLTYTNTKVTRAHDIWVPKRVGPTVREGFFLRPRHESTHERCRWRAVAGGGFALAFWLWVRGDARTLTAHATRRTSPSFWWGGLQESSWISPSCCCWDLLRPRPPRGPRLALRAVAGESCRLLALRDSWGHTVQTIRFAKKLFFFYYTSTLFFLSFLF